MTVRDFPQSALARTRMPSFAIAMPDVEIRALGKGRKKQMRAPVDQRGTCDSPALRPAYNKSLHCPFGAHSAQLWVAEAFRIRTVDAQAESGLASRYFAHVDYRADESSARFEIDQSTYRKLEMSRVRTWSPATRMPPWATRFILQIVAIRTECLQDISESDAIAEGARYFPLMPSAPMNAHQNRWSMAQPASATECLSSAAFAFANYFCKKHNGGHVDFSHWDADPLLWVAEFDAIRVAPIHKTEGVAAS
jgi:hypothetical protein